MKTTNLIMGFLLISVASLLVMAFAVKAFEAKEEQNLAAGPCLPSDLPSEKLSGDSCTMIYAPVCGIDGITYGNECMAGEMAIAHEGEC